MVDQVEGFSMEEWVSKHNLSGKALDEFKSRFTQDGFDSKAADAWFIEFNKENIQNHSIETDYDEDAPVIIYNPPFTKEELYAAIDEYGVAIMGLNNKFYPDYDSYRNAGAPGVNGIAVSDGTHRFCIAKDIIQHVCSTSSDIDKEYWGGSYTTVPEITTTTNSSTAIQDFNGVSNTDAIVDNVTSSDGYFKKAPWSAAGLCRLFAFPNGTLGHLGACGEWKLVQNSISAINTLMSAINGTELETRSGSYYWSSTQYSKEEAWAWSLYLKSNYVYAKSTSRHVRAFCSI